MQKEVADIYFYCAQTGHQWRKSKFKRLGVSAEAGVLDRGRVNQYDVSDDDSADDVSDDDDEAPTSSAWRGKATSGNKAPKKVPPKPPKKATPKAPKKVPPKAPKKATPKAAKKANPKAPKLPFKKPRNGALNAKELPKGPIERSKRKATAMQSEVAEETPNKKARAAAEYTDDDDSDDATGVPQASSTPSPSLRPKAPRVAKQTMALHVKGLADVDKMARESQLKTSGQHQQVRHAQHDRGDGNDGEISH